MAGSNATTRGVPRRILQGDGPSVPIISAGAIPTIQYSTGSARALQQFSRDMFNLSAGFEDQLDRQAEAEATTAGAVAGVTGDFQLQDYGTIRGRAFNKAAVETMAATLETRSIEKLNALQEQYWNDPDGLKTAWDDYRGGVADTLRKQSPEQAIAFEQRSIVRGMPLIEQAKDTRYKLTRSEADAALIENEAAIRSEVKNVSADLFSENPDRSRAAAAAIGAVQADYMNIYNAVDPTGKPLYSPEEKAKAKKDFADLAMSQATLSWFDEQPDKAGAYMKFLNGDFKMKINSSNDQAKIVMANQGARRNDPLQEDIANKIKAAAAATGVDVVVHSGGQETREEVMAGNGRRTGSVRHDHGGAADLRLSRNGKVLSFNENRELYRQFAENAAAAGLTGIGVDEAAGYIHAGGGSVAAWGYRGRRNGSEFLPRDFGEAIERGRKSKLESKPSVKEIAISEVLSPAMLNSLDAEMRGRIGFLNTMTDRKVSQEQAVHAKIQERNAFDYTARLYAAGTTDPTTGQPVRPLTREDVLSAVRNGLMKTGDGETLIKAMATEQPETSDDATYREIQRRLYNGEDVYSMIIESGAKLSKKDAAELLGKNQSQNRGSEGGFNNDQKFYFDTLKQRLGQTGLLDKFDQGKQDRAAAAYDEYRRRVLDPENTESPSVIADDIAARATNDAVQLDMSKLGRMVMPRFAVPIEGQNRLNILQSKNALIAAKEAGEITQSQFEIEAERLVKWAELQTQVDKQNAAKPKGN